VKTLFQLFYDSVLLQILLAIIVVGPTVYCAVTQPDVPKELWGLSTLIVGFYFGSKTAVEARKVAREVGRDSASRLRQQADD
jgi:hypothetical protein